MSETTEISGCKWATTTGDLEGCRTGVEKVTQVCGVLGHLVKQVWGLSRAFWGPRGTGF